MLETVVSDWLSNCCSTILNFPDWVGFVRFRSWQSPQFSLAFTCPCRMKESIPWVDYQTRPSPAPEIKRATQYFFSCTKWATSQLWPGGCESPFVWHSLRLEIMMVMIVMTHILSCSFINSKLRCGPTTDWHHLNWTLHLGGFNWQKSFEPTILHF